MIVMSFLLLVTLTTNLWSAPEPARADVACAGAPCPTFLHFGAFTPRLPNDIEPFKQYISTLGAVPDVGLTFTSFRYPMNPTALSDLARNGQMPMVTWEPWDPTTPAEDRYPLDAIAAGDFDAYLRAQAAALKNLGTPVALRFGHEMNGSWYPWGAGVRGNTAASYVAAYRHVHDVVTAAGATNVTWVWSPTALDTVVQPDLRTLYPGDAYVDWIGPSAYYDDVKDTYDRTVRPLMRKLDQVAPSKPIYLAETGVLPGPDRARMIHDLVAGLIATPRTIGVNWLEAPSRHDWRLSQDDQALAALRSELTNGWFAPSIAGTQNQPAPVSFTPPQITGAVVVGSVLRADEGVWRQGPTPAPLTYSGRWLRCPDVAEPVTCSPTNVTTASYDVGLSDLGMRLRYESTATSSTLAIGGSSSTTASSTTAAVLVTPAAPASPEVVAHNGAARVIFPPAPAGATGWRITLGGVPKHVVPIDQRDYWLTGLTNGQLSTLSLQAVSASRTGSLTSAPSTGTIAALPSSYAPYVVVRGTSATLTLPTAPGGSRGWSLEVDGDESSVPLTTRTVTLGPLTTGSPHTVRLRAGTGTWDGRLFGAMTPGSLATFTPVAAPAVSVVAGTGSLTFTLQNLPDEATAWRVSVGPKVYADLGRDRRTFTVAGLYPGYPATWKVQAVNASAASDAVTGRTAPS
jgi:hypothetical protein